MLNPESIFLWNTVSGAEIQNSEVRFNTNIIQHHLVSNLEKYCIWQLHSIKKNQNTHSREKITDQMMVDDGCVGRFAL